LLRKLNNMFLMNLPNISIETQIPDDTVLFVLGGRAPSESWLSAIAFQTEVWAVDRGVNVCDAAGIVPSMLIGDADSADSVIWQKMSKNGITQVAKYNCDKDLTDFQLALELYGKRHKGGGVFLTGCFGGRFDHLWSVLMSFLKSADYKAVGLADDKEGMIILSGGEKIALNFEKMPLAVSILPFSKRCQGVYINGTKWELENAELEYFKPYSISNRVDEDMRVEAGIKNGQMALYWCW